MPLKFSTSFYERNCVNPTVRIVTGQSKFYLTKFGLQNTGADLGEGLVDDAGGFLDGRAVEEEGGEEGFFLLILDERVEVLAAGPGVVLEFVQEAIEQHPGQVRGVNPFMGKRMRDGFAEFLEMQAKQQQVVFGRVGEVDQTPGREAGRAS